MCCEFEPGLLLSLSVLNLWIKATIGIEVNSVFVSVFEQWRFGFIKRWMSLHGIFHVTSVHRHCICCCDLIPVEICHSHMAQHDARFYSHWHSIRDNCSLACNVNPSPFWVGMIVYKCPLMRQNQIYMDLRGGTVFNLTATRLWGMDTQPVIEVFRPRLIFFIFFNMLKNNLHA